MKFNVKKKHTKTLAENYEYIKLRKRPGDITRGYVGRQLNLSYLLNVYFCSHIFLCLETFMINLQNKKLMVKVFNLNLVYFIVLSSPRLIQFNFVLERRCAEVLFGHKKFITNKIELHLYTFHGARSSPHWSFPWQSFPLGISPLGLFHAGLFSVKSFLRRFFPL